MRALSLVAVAGIALAACRGGTPEAAGSGAAGAAAAPQKAPVRAAADRNACRLLTHEEVSDIAGSKVTMADQIEAGDVFSTCEWQDEAGVSAFSLTVHWSGGREQWDTWRLAQGLGDAALEAAEGVRGSDVVKQGLVAGIGDAAYFSPVLPSLVLKGDTLFEIKFSLAPKADEKFKGLAATLLERAK
jgi:hypothetical protein